MTTAEPDVEIRQLAYSDLAAVMAIERRAFTSPWSLPMFVLELSKAGGICLAAMAAPAVDRRDGGVEAQPELVGYLICSRYGDTWHIMNIAVDPDHRRRGIARALLDELISRAGYDASYTLEVRVSNTPAIALYESYDFRGVGTRKRYYADNGEDAVIMWRALGDPWLAR
jgi:ribosomal-protein-alanine N-acetyltransferase